MLEQSDKSPEAIVRDWIIDQLQNAAVEHKRANPRFEPIYLQVNIDEREDYFLSFLDDMGWFNHLPLSLISKKPEEISLKDQVFQLTDSTFAFVHCCDAGPPEFFLLDNHNVDNSPLVKAMWRQRSKIIGLLSQSQAPAQQHLLDAVEAMPYFKGGFPSNVLMVRPWNADLISEPLSNEPKPAYETRASRIKNPIEVRDIYHIMSPELQKTLVGPAVTFLGLSLFSSFFAEADEIKRSKIEKAHSLAKENSLQPAFINAFGACEAGWEVGEAILAMIEQPYMIAVLQRDEELFLMQQYLLSRRIENIATILRLNLEDEHWYEVIDRMHRDLDKNMFRTVIAQKRAELLNCSGGKEPDWKNFEPWTVLWGALFRGITNHLPLEQSSEMVQILLKDSSISVLNGNPKLINDASSEAMKSEANYPHPDSFKKSDYFALLEYLKASYEKNDPDLCTYLISQIPPSLQDKNTTWIFIRKDERLIGVCKLEPHRVDGNIVPNEYECGTLYVAPKFRGIYGVGAALQKFVFAMIPEGSTIIGQTAIVSSTPALERNIDRGWEVGRKLVKKGNGFPLVEMARHKSHANYPSKSYERVFIKDQAVDLTSLSTSNPSFSDNMHFFKLDTSPQVSDDFANFLNQFFNSDYVLTRIFYERLPGGKLEDLSQTYIVLEKVINFQEA